MPRPRFSRTPRNPTPPFHFVPKDAATGPGRSVAVEAAEQAEVSYKSQLCPAARVDFSRESFDQKDREPERLPRGNPRRIDQHLFGGNPGNLWVSSDHQTAFGAKTRLPCCPCH